MFVAFAKFWAFFKAAEDYKMFMHGCLQRLLVVSSITDLISTAGKTIQSSKSGLNRVMGIVKNWPFREFYIHGSVHRETSLITVQQDANWLL